MKRRILSLVLALMMCFTVLSTVTFAEDVELMASPMGEVIRLYTERAWDWQEGQFNAMTDEQKAVIENAYANFDEEAVRAIAAATAEEVLDTNTTFFTNDTMKDLYRWKTMRDMVEGRIDATSADAAFVDWFNRFKEYEAENDDKVSAAQPNAALGGLGDYSDDLTEFFGELSEMYSVDGLRLTGEDADKVHAYIEAHLADDITSVMDALKADVYEIIAEGSANGFELALQVACQKKVRGDEIFGAIEDRDMKGAFLLFGEDFVKFVMDEVPSLREDLVGMDKTELLKQLAGVGGTAIGVLNGSNETSYNAMYAVANEVSAHVEGQDFLSELVGKLTNDFGFDVAVVRAEILEGIKDAMATLDASHGIELVHFDAYVGRTVLQPEMNSVIEVEAGKESVINLSYDHPRYKFVGETLATLPPVTQFDIEVVGDGITASLAEEIGVINVDATADGIEDGDEVVLNLYRGYDDDLNANDKDVYRYVTTYTLKAVGSTQPPVVDDPYVELDDVKNTTVDGTITVKGTTNLDYVTVAIVKPVEGGVKTIYAVVYTKDEFEAGITLNAPDAAVEGEEYTVVVGTEKASDSDEFEIEGATEDYFVELNDVENTTVDGIITVKGTTNLDYVTVAIVKPTEDGVKTIYAVVYTKAEFEAGIALQAPDNAVVGEVYTVVVGTEKASDSDEFEIEGVTEDYFVDLEDVANTTVEGTITVKGTTNLDYVTVVIVKPTEDGDKTIYTVVYTKDEFEAGITLNAPADAVVGEVYTVVVGTEKASDSDEFEIESTVTPGPAPTLSLAGDKDGDGVMDRTVKKGSKVEITTTPQNIPEGSTAEVIWTITNGDGEVEQVKVAGDFNNILQIKGTKIGEGVVITGTLYVDGVATDATVTVNVKVKKSGGGGGGYEKPTEEPTEDDDNKPHSCEWPDIAAGWEGKANAHWAHLTIDQMTINGYIKGYPDGLFRPDQNITRAEFSAIVYRILGLNEAEDGVKYDDTVGHWAEDLIATMSLPEGYGMLRGYGDGNFGPNDNITREQAVAIIARAKSAVWVAANEGAKDVFTDAEDISWWFDGEMDAAVTNGLITGYEDGSYKPLNFTTRAEACTLLARAWPEVLE